jgi:dipeptidyl aminopeptidase/acylaminoacyl peptidase
MRQEPSGGDIKVLRTELENDAYTRQQIEYRSGDATVSGVLLRPRGRGPFPAVVLNHGYIEPEIYVTGQGLAREQDALARAGFVVLHTDYRGHATSDPVRPLEQETRLAYTRDSANAVKALETLQYVDPDRIGMLGRSMGGGVTMNVLVAYPGLVDAAVTWSSVSSDLVENLRHFTEPGRPDAAQGLYDRLGTPEDAPDAYAALSARTYFDRITEPVLVHHATTDETCPFPWARETERLMRKAGVDSRLFVYQGEAHAFVPQWQIAMDRTIRFLRQRLR